MSKFSPHGFYRQALLNAYSAQMNDKGHCCRNLDAGVRNTKQLIQMNYSRLSMTIYVYVHFKQDN